eukprot:COSAG01_NODE_46761_length_397_cov_0.848993_1_plen_54_part_10
MPSHAMMKSLASDLSGWTEKKLEQLAVGELRSYCQHHGIVITDRAHTGTCVAGL